MKIIENTLIRENENLIWEITKKFYNVDKNDLFQAGALGLVKAYRNYKNNGTTKFSTYAYNYIYGEMYLLSMQKEIKVSKDIIKLSNMIEKVRTRLSQELGYIPSIKELSKYLTIDEEKIRLVMQSSYQMISLDDNKDGSRSMYEEISSNENISQLDRLFLNDCLNSLTDIERKIIKSRYYDDLTQSQTATKLGLTQVMVSRYENKSLKKMREYTYM